MADTPQKNPIQPQQPQRAAQTALTPEQQKAAYAAHLAQQAAMQRAMQAAQQRAQAGAPQPNAQAAQRAAQNTAELSRRQMAAAQQAAMQKAQQAAIQRAMQAAQQRAQADAPQPNAQAAQRAAQNTTELSRQQMAAAQQAAIQKAQQAAMQKAQQAAQQRAQAGAQQAAMQKAQQAAQHAAQNTAELSRQQMAAAQQAAIQKAQQAAMQKAQQAAQAKMPVSETMQNKPAEKAPVEIKKEKQTAAKADSASRTKEQKAVKKQAQPEKTKKREKTSGKNAPPNGESRLEALKNTATVNFEKIALGMQRGANDGAVLEARKANTLPPRLVYNALGQMLYRVGLQTEYGLLRLWRALSQLGALIGKGVWVLLLAALRPLWGLVRGIGQDLLSPFVHIFSGIWHVIGIARGAKKAGEDSRAAVRAYVKSGLELYKHIGKKAVGYLLPTTAAVILGLTVWNLLGTDYSLAVKYNGEMIGFVESENTWEDAQIIIRNRIKAAKEGEEFVAKPEFSIKAVDVAARRSASNLADTIIATSPDQIQKATGIYVNDDLVGVCADGSAVQNLLDQTLSADGHDDNPDVRTEFVNHIRQDEGLYFTASIEDMTQLKQTLQERDALQIKTIVKQTYEEVLPFETIKNETNEYYKGVQRVQKRGVNGKQSITADISYVDGVEIGREILSTETLVPAVNQVVTVGTKEVVGAVGQVGTGTLSFPVPGYSYLTTLFGQGGHRGVDICGPYGTPVYACDNGTVTESGWHWSWGYYVKIDHGNGMETLYAHNSSLLVAVGTPVTRGQIISLMGSTGNSSGNHCHLEVYLNGSLTNPLAYFNNY